MNYDEMQDGGAIFALVIVFFVVFIVIAIASSQAKKHKEQQEKERLEMQKQKVTGKNPAYLNSLKEKLNQRKAGSSLETGVGLSATKSTLGAQYQPFGDGEHDHYATDFEFYDPAVGSVGAVSDEGCAELNGIRLIVNDPNFDEDGQQHAKFEVNGEKIALTMILGEVLENPKFRKHNPKLRN